MGAKCDSSRHRGSVEAGQPRLIARERIGLFRIAVRSQATMMEKFRNALSQRRGQPRDLFIIGGEQNLTVCWPNVSWSNDDSMR